MRYGYYPYSLPELYTKLKKKFWGDRLPQAVTCRSELVLGGPAKDRGVLVQRFWTSEEGYPLIHACGMDAWGLFDPPTDDWPAKIRVVSLIGAGRERQSLLHEMVHCALWFGGMPDAGHGPRFVAELERLVSEGEEWAREEAEKYREPS